MIAHDVFCENEYTENINTDGQDARRKLDVIRDMSDVETQWKNSSQTNGQVAVKRRRKGGKI